MSTSIAAVMQAPGVIELTSLPVPDPEPGAVVMQVHLSGICGTDKHTYRGESKQYVGTPHERDISYPLICGHENVGTVVALGGEVRDADGVPLRVGDRIVPGANVPCGDCYYCRNEYPYYFCNDLEDYGNSLSFNREPKLFGGWSQYMYLLPRTPIFRVPDGLPDEVAVLTEVMAVTHGVDKAVSLLKTQRAASSGFSVAVLGVGPLGLCHLLKARLLGAGTVIATDPLAGRLEFAKRFGLDLGINTGLTTLAERQGRVLDATNGRGVDVVLDCSGVPETFVEALRVVRTGGVVVEAGAFVDLGPVSINPNSDICTRSVSVIGVGGEEATEYVPAMRLMRANLDRYPIADITTHILSLGESADGLALAQSGAAMQVAFDPRAPIRSTTDRTTEEGS